MIICVVQGILFAGPDTVEESTDLALLWLHESCRVYSDRLVDVKDLRLFRKLQMETVHETFEVQYRFGVNSITVRHIQVTTLTNQIPTIYYACPLPGTGGQKGDKAAPPLLPLCPNGRWSLLCACYRLGCTQVCPHWRPAELQWAQCSHESGVVWRCHATRVSKAGLHITIIILMISALNKMFSFDNIPEGKTLNTLQLRK